MKLGANNIVLDDKRIYFCAIFNITENIIFILTYEMIRVGEIKAFIFYYVF